MATIVLVEDDGVLRQMLADLLGELGHDVHTIPQAEALTGELLRELKPAMVITDLVLPGVWGDRLCALLATARRALGLKVLLISDANPDELATRAKAAGADGWVSKRQLLADPRAAIHGLVPDKEVTGTSEITTPEAAVGKAVAKHLKDHHSRLGPRAGCKIPLAGHDPTVGVFKGIIENLSMGGAKLVANVSLPVHSNVQVAFRLESLGDVEVSAEVVWAGPGPMPQLTAMGLQFKGVSAEQQQRIEKYLSQALPELY